MSESVRFRRWLAAFGLAFWTVGSASASPNAGIATLMTTLSERGQFNGAILVAQEGKIIYWNAFGKANFQTGVDFTPETPSNIGSLTKQFTAMAIMILAERNKLRYDDPVANYIPEFQSYQTAAKLGPTNGHAESMLTQLK
jgi:CubicO group peptidase (beta-lactamase class C family)